MILRGWRKAPVEGASLLRVKFTIAAAVTVALLLAANFYTVEVLSPRAGPSIPSYPSIIIGFSGGNLTVLIRGALGAYLYREIEITGNYTYGGRSMGVNKSVSDSYYLGIKVPAEYLAFNSTAFDAVNHIMYYFNATVSVSLRLPTSDTLYIWNGGQTNAIVLGSSPFDGSMEGISHS